MKKLMIFTLVLMLAAFMAACGTNNAEEGTSGEQAQEDTTEENEASEETETSSGDTDEVTEEEQPAEETEEAEESEAPAEEEPAEEGNEETEESEAGTEMRLLEQPMTLSINGEETERTAFLQESGENNYSFYLAQGFTFTPEEPTVDQVFYDEDGSQFMRIYTYPKAESETALIEKQMKGQADAIQGEAAGEWKPESSANEIIAGYEAAAGEEQFKTYLYEQNDQYVRIAIHTKADTGLEDAFIQMAETIE